MQRGASRAGLVVIGTIAAFGLGGCTGHYHQKLDDNGCKSEGTEKHSEIEFPPGSGSFIHFGNDVHKNMVGTLASHTHPGLGWGSSTAAGAAAAAKDCPEENQSSNQTQTAQQTTFGGGLSKKAKTGIGVGLTAAVIGVIANDNSGSTNGTN